MITKIFIIFLGFSTTSGLPVVANNRLTVAASDTHFVQNHMGPGTYAFAYNIDDPATGNVQFRQEERYVNGTVIGSYGYLNENGEAVVVTYVSDEKGYRATIEKKGDPLQHFPNQDDPQSFKQYRGESVSLKISYLMKQQV